MDNIENSTYAAALSTVEALYHGAKTQEFALPGPIEAVWNKYRLAVTAAMQTDPRLFPTGAQLTEKRATATKIAQQAADELRAIMAVPREEREEAWCRVYFKPSPRAMREGDHARLRAQNERDAKAREDAQLDPAKYVAALMKRGVAVWATEDGRLYARGATVEDSATLANKRADIIKTIGTGIEIRPLMTAI